MPNQRMKSKQNRFKVVKNKINSIRIKYKTYKKGFKMSEEESQDIETSMLENAVFQQLFAGSNRIMGKNPANTMQITGVNLLLRRFIYDLRFHMNWVKQQKLDDFLAYFAKRFNVNLDEVKERIESNFAGMGNLEGQETVVIYMTLTKLLENLREQAYKQYGRDAIENAFKETTGKNFGDKEAEKIQNLAALNEENISLLYNLSFVAFLAISYNNKALSSTVKRLVSTKVNKIVEKIQS